MIYQRIVLYLCLFAIWILSPVMIAFIGIVFFPSAYSTTAVYMNHNHDYGNFVVADGIWKQDVVFSDPVAAWAIGGGGGPPPKVQASGDLAFSEELLDKLLDLNRKKAWRASTGPLYVSTTSLGGSSASFALRYKYGDVPGVISRTLAAAKVIPGNSILSFSYSIRPIVLGPVGFLVALWVWFGRSDSRRLRRIIRGD